MKLTYIYHSCYLIEGETFDIIIDYFRDSEKEGIIHKRVSNNSKKLYVLASHSHPDHFNPEILGWKAQNSNIEYVFSKDILDEGVACLADGSYIDKLEEYSNEGLKIKAFGSTDIGISFLIEMDGKQIFHAGDLNNWHWREESTITESRMYEENYLEELDLIYQNIKHLDLLMFPIDPNLGKDYMLGAEQFVSKIKVDLFAPMHFHDRYDKVAAFKSYASKQGCEIFLPKSKGESAQILI